ncbi:MAG: hypothetical protein PHS54_07615 [Clostridia bacterium]|nr:hypothetical protein [Clostridia bacterium]
MNKRKDKIIYSLWITKEEERFLLNAMDILKEHEYKKLEQKIGELIKTLYFKKELEKR